MPLRSHHLDARVRVAKHAQRWETFVDDARGAPADEVARGAADLIRDTLGFNLVAFNRFRPVWGDYEAALVRGSTRASLELVGTKVDQETWERYVEQPRFRAAPAVYFWPGEHPVPDDHSAVPAWLPELPKRHHANAWDPDDGLFLQLRGRGGTPLGTFSLDEPHSGRRPTRADLGLLKVVQQRATDALASAGLARRTAHWLSEAEALTEAPARFALARQPSDVHQELCRLATTAFGFRRAVLYRATPSGDLHVAQTEGDWPAAAHDVIRRPLSAAAASTLLRGTSPDGGGQLVTTTELRSPRNADEARALFDERRMATGSDAWRKLVLLLPMRTTDGRLAGILAVEHVQAQLLPKASTRRMLDHVVGRAQLALQALAA